MLMRNGSFVAIQAKVETNVARDKDNAGCPGIILQLRHASVGGGETAIYFTREFETVPLFPFQEILAWFILQRSKCLKNLL